MNVITRISLTVAAVLAVGVSSVSTAMAGLAASSHDPQELRALIARSQALNRLHGGRSEDAFVPGVTDFPARPAYVDPSRTSPTISESLASRDRSSFDLRSAGLGAAIALGSILLVAVGLGTRRALGLRQIGVAALLALPLTGLGGLAAATAGDRSLVQAAVEATASFHDLVKAKAAGYTVVVTDTSGATCIAQPGQGAMGVHYLNPSLVDGTLDPTAPEVLVYEAKPDGELKLVALEYLVFESAWQGIEPPSLFGRTFDYVPSPNRYGVPPFYALHAWLWKPNPSDLFFAWNPRVTCDES